MNRILIIEDEISIHEVLNIALQNNGFITKGVFNAEDGLIAIKTFKPDIIVLDLMLPKMSGEEFCKKINGEYPILMISAKNQINDKLNGLEIGADDYIVKPFDIREVVLRIKNVLKRLRGGTTETGIIINKHNREVRKAGDIIDLNRKEFEILNLFFENKGVVFSRESLLSSIWGYDYEGSDRTVDVHIRRLRKKLREDKNESIIETIFGVGYVMRK